MGWIMGFEPMISSATNSRVNQLRYIHHIGALGGTRTPDPLLRRQLLYPPELQTLERVMGIEPTRPAWKAGVLPLNYTRITESLFNCSTIIIYFKFLVKSKKKNSPFFLFCKTFYLSSLHFV